MSGLHRHPEFRRGVADFLPPALGIAAWGLMTGVAIAKSGMGWIEMIAMSIFVYAGSSQLAALPLLAAGSPVLVVLATAFCVNLRFVVFSLHLRPYIVQRPRAQRLLFGYLMGDMGYVLLLRRHPRVPTDAAGVAAVEAYWLGSGVAAWVNWTGSTLVGLALGNAVPPSWGLGFAGLLALTGIAVSLTSSRLRLVSAVIAAGAAIATISLPMKLNIVSAIAVAVAICLALDKAKRLHGRRTSAGAR